MLRLARGNCAGPLEPDLRKPSNTKPSRFLSLSSTPLRSITSSSVNGRMVACRQALADLAGCRTVRCLVLAGMRRRDQRPACLICDWQRHSGHGAFDMLSWPSAQSHLYAPCSGAAPEVLAARFGLMRDQLRYSIAACKHSESVSCANVQLTAEAIIRGLLV